MCDLADSPANRGWHALYRPGMIARLLLRRPAGLPGLRGARAGWDQAAPDRVFPKAYVALSWLLSSAGGFEYPALSHVF